MPGKILGEALSSINVYELEHGTTVSSSSPGSEWLSKKLTNGVKTGV